MEISVQINGVEYIRADSVPAAKPTRNRAVVVVDRGWIFAGGVTRENNRNSYSYGYGYGYVYDYSTYSPHRGRQLQESAHMLHAIADELDGTNPNEND